MSADLDGRGRESQGALLGSQRRNAERVRRHLEEQISSVAPGLLASHPIEAYVERLDRCERIRGYRFVPPDVHQQCDEIAARCGVRALEMYHKTLLLWLIENYEERRTRHRIPAAILGILSREFDRILSGVESPGEEFHVHQNDLFAKDLGVCRMKLVPCGSELVDLWSGVSRSTLLRGGVVQLVRGAQFFGARLRGFKPLYETHWDRRLVRRFTAAEYDLCYVRIAKLLELNPEVKGMFGTSWWYDPHLAGVSPELVFLTKTPVENGARVFRVGPDPDATKDALQFSTKRKALYEAGSFAPTRYMLVWSREDMLDWAGRFAATGDFPPGKV